MYLGYCNIPYLLKKTLRLIIIFMVFKCDIDSSCGKLRTGLLHIIIYLHNLFALFFGKGLHWHGKLLGFLDHTNKTIKNKWEKWWPLLGPTFYIGVGPTLMNIRLGATFLYRTRANIFEFFEIFQYIWLGPTIKVRISN